MTKPPPEPADPETRQRGTILIADDGADNRVILERLLQLSHFDTLVAENGDEAVTMASSHRPDLILMDLAMPKTDGWEATRRIKADAALRHIPIIAVTGHVTADEIERATEAGCSDVLAKPIVYEDLVRIVRENLVTSP
ncbi:MAG: response regulator [Acidobacteriota bacterium]